MRPTGIKQIAKQRIQILFDQAKKVCKTDPQLATQYIKSARRIAMAAKIRLPLEFRRQTCKNCNSLLVQGSNCRVRIKQKRESHVVITCLNCGNQTRILLSKRKGQKNLSKITTRMKRHVRHVLKDENPTIWVGKEGLTDQLASEIEKQLQRNKMVKVKVLPAAIQGDDKAQTIAAKAAEKTNAALVEVRGHVFILFRKRKAEEKEEAAP
jgi:putative YhbY family RNA-binding protein